MIRFINKSHLIGLGLACVIPFGSGAALAESGTEHAWQYQAKICLSLPRIDGTLLHPTAAGPRRDVSVDASDLLENLSPAQETTSTRGPRGPFLRQSVVVKAASVGTPKLAARWTGPVSPPTTARAPSRTWISSVRSVAGAS